MIPMRARAMRQERHLPADKQSNNPLHLSTSGARAAGERRAFGRRVTVITEEQSADEHAGYPPSDTVYPE